MIVNAPQFVTQVQANHDEVINVDFVNLVKDIALTFVEEVAILTPFKTGRARQGWRVSVNTEDQEEHRNEPLAVAQIVNLARVALQDLKPFEQVFVQNRTLYISFLNAGSSKMAAAGFVELALEQTNQAFSKAP